MKKILYSCALIFLFSSCVSKKIIVKKTVKKTYQKTLTYKSFIKALKTQNVKRINSLLNIQCKFTKVYNTANFYGFFRNNKLLIGPFPLKAYANEELLSLTRPAGVKANDFSIFHVYSQKHDLYFYFGEDNISIEGSGISEFNQRKTFIY